MLSQQDTTQDKRQAKALALIESGKVRLFPGRGYAEVVGSNGTTYRITKRDGCNCPNGLSRDPRSCYHAAACRALCEEYRAAAAQARDGQTVRPSVALLRALGWQVGTPIAAPAEPTCDVPGHEGVGGATRCNDCDRMFCRECWQYHRCGRSDSDQPVRIPAGALVDANGVPYCHDCGEDLIGGVCPRRTREKAA